MNHSQQSYPARRWLAVLFLGALLGGAPLPGAKAYVLEGNRWPSDQPIVMNLGLGKPNTSLTDGSDSWDEVAQAALDIWNPVLGSGIQFEGVEATFAPSDGDGKNSVFFSSTIYGEDFGDDTLAVTLSHSDSDTHVKDEADVVVNSAQTFDSYRTGTYSSKYDLRRVLIHEFGHVLGLEHVAQNVTSIMTPIINNFDTIQDDDIAGVIAIYGTPGGLPYFFGGNQTAFSQEWQGFSFQYKSTGPITGYTASGLPAGLTIDPATGAITGTPTEGGNFNVTITAANAAGPRSTNLSLAVAFPPLIVGGKDFVAVAGQPFAYQLVVPAYQATYYISDSPRGVDFNAATGLLWGTPSQTGAVVTRLSTNLPSGGGTSQAFSFHIEYDLAAAPARFLAKADGDGFANPLVQGADGNFYGVFSGDTVYHQSSKTFGSAYRMSPDGTLTVLHQFSATEGNGPSGVLVPDADGSFYGTTDAGGLGGGTFYRMASDSTVTTLCNFPASGDPFGQSHTALVRGRDGNFYGATNRNTPPSPSGGDYGAIWRLTPDGTPSVLHAFTDDERQCSALVQGVDGNFYGTFGFGLAHPRGTIFKMTPDGTVTTLHAITDAEEPGPRGLVLGSDGAFYGATCVDDFNVPVTVFKVTTDGVLTTLYTFASREVGQPSVLVEGRDGNFYGTFGKNGYGTTPAALYRFTPGGAATALHRFADDEVHVSALVQGTDGRFYGVEDTGVALQTGAIFRTSFDDAAPDGYPPTVTLTATTPAVIAGSGGAAVFTVALPIPRHVDTVVHYAIKGSAVNGTDYVLLSGTKTIKAGKASKKIKIVPQGNLGGAAKKTVVLALEPDDGYTVGTVGKVKVKILAGR